MKRATLFGVEGYPNYFLIALKRLGYSTTRYWETTNPKGFTMDKRRDIMNTLSRLTLIGFNSSHYDLLMISAAIQGYPVKQLHRLSCKIINGKMQSWQIKRAQGLTDVTCHQHIDLMSSLPYQQRLSLKMVACRIGFNNIQDLPYEFNKCLTHREARKVRAYCFNDIGVTEALYKEVKDTVDMKMAIGKKFGTRTEWWNLKDSVIAERVMRQRLRVNQVNSDLERIDPVGRYSVPDWINYKSANLQKLIDIASRSPLELNTNGRVSPPGNFSRQKVSIGNTDYKLGIGGLHSQEKHVSAYNSPTCRLIDLDVTSYYPAIIQRLGIAPVRIEDRFPKVYAEVVKQRVQAKRDGDKVLDASLKIVINSVFGKLSNRYSCVFSPYHGIAVTMTGQLSLLKLIEKLEKVEGSVISANTDGLVCLVDDSVQHDFDNAKREWESATGFNLEETLYESIHIRDVNNYLAFKLDGTHKGKGVFAPPGIAKGLYPTCITDAVISYLRDGKDMEDTIRGTWDPQAFCFGRQVNGGAKHGRNYLGRVARWVWDEDAQEFDSINYVSNGNRTKCL